MRSCWAAALPSGSTRARPRGLGRKRLLALTASLGLVIANLDCCLAIGGRPTRRVPHKPFFFRGLRSSTAQLRQLNVRAVGLANNHALVYEESALGETLTVLDHGRRRRCRAQPTRLPRRLSRQKDLGGAASEGGPDHHRRIGTVGDERGSAVCSSF
ncbi:MAG TPA: CapA family protein [Solirubrobacteraceae bacterium]|nr:CapA family protein [Solirubrobacteraceae bacterium]